MKTRLLLCTFFIVSISHAQTFDWWKNLVQWDGLTHWSKYITYNSKYMGANALPVPAIGNGSADSISSIRLTGNFHFSKGDVSQNPTLYVNYGLVKNRVSLDLNWIPVEWFKMTHTIKEERKVYWEDYYLKKANGDINLHMNIQLLNRWRKNIHLAFRIGYRFPTSSGVGAARMTNKSGYFFDLSAGKLFSPGSNWKWIGMVGFYVWETNQDRSRLYQDDAFLFGAGAECNTKTIHLQTYFAGYLGYMDDSGDKPILFRTKLEKKLKRNSLFFSFQQGLHDFKYSSFESGLNFVLGK